MVPALDPDAAREQLAHARLLLIFTPSLCAGRDPLAVLEALLPHIDIVQVRPKAPDSGLDPARTAPAAPATSEAREVFTWSTLVLERVQCLRPQVLVLANDRVDVARALVPLGLAGVHLGQEDCPPAVARALLGPDALIGLSTHGLPQVLAAEALPVDYLGFGPLFPTRTKGYVRGLGAQAAWIAQQASALPLFPIGGIDLERVGELEELGRAAVSSALLAAADPGAAAAALRAVLEGGA